MKWYDWFLLSALARSVQRQFNPTLVPLWLIIATFFFPLIFSWFILFGDYNRPAKILTAFWLGIYLVARIRMLHH